MKPTLGSRAPVDQLLLRARKQSALTWLLLGLSTACTPEATTMEFPKNHCATSTDCWWGTGCNTELGWCTVSTMEEPYTVVLQISPNPYTSTGRFTWIPIRLEKALSAPLDLEIPTFDAVEGLIQCQGKAIMAEAVFYPRGQSGYPIAPVSSRSSDKDPSATTNFGIRLPPGRDFDVAIQPLGLDSEQCPPFRTTFSVGIQGLWFGASTPELVTITGRLVEDGSPVEDPAEGAESATKSPLGPRLQVRVWSKSAKRAVSGTVKAQVGGQEFTLNTIPGEMNDRVLQIDLDPVQPWQEVLEVPLASRTSAGTIRVPAVPERVTLHGLVEASAKRPAPFTELAFSSSFPLPATSGGRGNLDWCQLRKQSSDPSEVACHAERTVRTDEQGNYKVELLPGRYEILVSPGSEDAKGNSLGVAATRLVLVVESQKDGASQGPYNPVLRAAAKIEGLFEDPDGTPLPNVTVQSLALAETRTANSISAFNRSAYALTDERGEFVVSLDSGFYDVVAKPPPGSGYPWLYLANREYDSNKPVYRPKGTFSPPLVITGQVRLQAMSRPMPGAAVDAYGLIQDLRGRLRPVLIGSAIADEKGEYVLSLPPSLNNERPSP